MNITNQNYKGIAVDRNLVSACCLASVVTGTEREYPLGGVTWFQSFKVELCEKCQQTCDVTDSCQGCGEVECQGECLND